MSEVAEGESSKSLKSVAIVATVVGTSFLNVNGRRIPYRFHR